MVIPRPLEDLEMIHSTPDKLPASLGEDPNYRLTPHQLSRIGVASPWEV
jgi:hypothetical protein